MGLLLQYRRSSMFFQAAADMVPTALDFCSGLFKHLYRRSIFDYSNFHTTGFHSHLRTNNFCNNHGSPGRFFFKHH